jgi:cation-transporting ATPase F
VSLSRKRIAYEINRRSVEHIQLKINEGLDFAEIKHRLNKVSIKKNEGSIVLFIRQFSQSLVYILVAAGVITTILLEWVDTAVIFGVVLVNTAVG